MARASASRTTERRAKQSAGGLPKGGAGRTKVVQRDTKAGHVVVSKARFEAVMRAAEQSGLLREKSSRIGGRGSPALGRQTKRPKRIETHKDLIQFALA